MICLRLPLALYAKVRQLHARSTSLFINLLTKYAFIGEHFPVASGRKEGLNKAMKQIFLPLFLSFFAFLSACTPQSSTAPTPLTELQTEDLVIGNGPTVEGNMQVTAHYKGWLFDQKDSEGKGQEFENTYRDDQPLTFNLSQGMVIRGWDQGLLGMKVGGKRRLKVPTKLAYGEKSMGPIAPNSDLVFEVEILKVK